MSETPASLPSPLATLPPLDTRLCIIGRVRSPFREAAGTPIQPVYARGAVGEVVIEPALMDALDDLEGFERVWLIYVLHRADPFRAHVVPYRDTRPHGVLATRSPTRPNPIGLSVVRLLGRTENVLQVADLDLLDDTPLLDLKPYVPAFDAVTTSRAGWLDEAGVERYTADERFHRGGGDSR